MMKENLFKMGASFSDDWSSDNKKQENKRIHNEIRVPEKHLLHFTKEKRRGKIVTIIQPFYLKEKALKELLKTLKKKLGTGGTVKESTLEFQGEVKEALKVLLEKLDYRLK